MSPMSLWTRGSDTSSGSRAGFRMPEPWRAAWKTLKRNKLSLTGGGIAALFVLVSALAAMLAPYDPNAIDLARTLAPPGPAHWLGTDNQGRDLLSRVIFGARVSLYVGVGSITVGAGLGVPAGLLAGYYRGLNAPIMRLMDVLLAFPGIIVALTIVAILGPGLNNVVLAVGLSQVPQFARVVYGLVLIVREATYVESARGVGVVGPGVRARGRGPRGVTVGSGFYRPNSRNEISSPTRGRRYRSYPRPAASKASDDSPDTNALRTLDTKSYRLAALSENSGAPP